jgi:putative cardiolipin synthase
VDPIRAGFVSLHVKAMLGDRDKLFIGSLNLDPRAMVINTENGVYLESPELGERVAEMFDMLVSSENAWRVTIDKEKRLMWTSSKGVTYTQPARGFGQRLMDVFYWILPIESQL